MQNFDVELDTGGTRTRAAGIREEVSIGSIPLSESVTHLFADSHSWSWEQLRDYVVAQIEARTGPFLRNPGKEYGIFTSFQKRWGVRAGAIARYAFEVNDGRWMNGPITLSRFTKGSDPFFANEISKRLIED